MTVVGTRNSKEKNLWVFGEGSSRIQYLAILIIYSISDSMSYVWGHIGASTSTQAYLAVDPVSGDI